MCDPQQVYQQAQIQDRKWTLYFEKKIQRSVHCCIRGDITFTISPYSIQMQTSYSEEPCPTQFILYRILQGSTLVGWLVIDSQKQKGEVVFLQKIWNHPSQLRSILSLAAQGTQETIQGSLLDTFFSDFPFIKGYLYLIYSLLQTSTDGDRKGHGEENRDELIHNLMDNTWTKWFCEVTQKIQEEKLRLYEPIQQPLPLSIAIQHALDLGLVCEAIDTLLSFHCGVPLEQNTYDKYSLYADRFLDFYIHNHLPSSCFGGVIDIACNVKQKWAQVYDSDLHMECRAVQTVVLSIHLSMGPFESKSESKSELRDQVEEQRREGNVQGHSMALIVNNESKQIELFEPNGSSVPWLPLVLDALQDRFRSEFPDYEWVSTEEFCPREGIQGISRLAQCTYFSLLWMFLRISCPEIPRETLSTSLLRGGPKFILQLLTGLQCMILDWFHQHRLDPGFVFYYHY